MTVPGKEPGLLPVSRPYNYIQACYMAKPPLSCRLEPKAYIFRGKRKYIAIHGSTSSVEIHRPAMKAPAATTTTLAMPVLRPARPVFVVLAAEAPTVVVVLIMAWVREAVSVVETSIALFEAVVLGSAKQFVEMEAIASSKPGHVDSSDLYLLAQEEADDVKEL